MKFIYRMYKLFVLLFFCVVSNDLLGNNLIISNISTGNKDETNNLVSIQFDISWENSFRDVINHDAVWIFMKYRVPIANGGDNTWRHLILNGSGHVVPAGFELSLATDLVGVFLQRDVVGSGDVALSPLSLRWDYGAQDESTGNPIDDDDFVEINVFGIEMVYIPEAAFFVGSGSTGDAGSFTNGSWVVGNPIPLSIGSEGALDVSQNAGDLFAISSTFPFWEICSGCTLSDNSSDTGYPKGFHDFYSMKYETTQGQYADFLNMLTSTQASNRYPNMNGSSRHTISGAHPNFSTSTPHRPVNFLSWMDAVAYADWAGLRPMTELEYEKVSRGNMSPVQGENVTGTSLYNSADSRDLIADGTIVETTTGNVLLGDSIDGPLRSGWPGFIGIGTPGAGTREDAGASYYGVMELSGNLWEMCVSVHDDATGFVGSHGDGSLNTNGYADNVDWPGYSVSGVTTSLGAGRRGGGFNSLSDTDIRVSSRSNASVGSFSGLNRDRINGFRAVRTAQ